MHEIYKMFYLLFLRIFKLVFFFWHSYINIPACVLASFILNALYLVSHKFILFSVQLTHFLLHNLLVYFPLFSVVRL